MDRCLMLKCRTIRLVLLLKEVLVAVRNGTNYGTNVLFFLVFKVLDYTKKRIFAKNYERRMVG